MYSKKKKGLEKKTSQGEIHWRIIYLRIVPVFLENHCKRSFAHGINKRRDAVIGLGSYGGRR